VDKNGVSSSSENDGDVAGRGRPLHRDKPPDAGAERSAPARRLD